ncbi:hypothetical protein D1164_22170 [Mariniphaga sediminis]|uniref:Thioredoxin domain-containing protein n=1 Tax=Mariniphaga sediminis TaxID=1628158 RepID=A0A399CT38_9BACT|nr:redoxin domain-containing protein [Mariniphaga sediminis]RIH62989.1 hypothetical protein D1164_22170 [Mariniphaga sediminis]
MLKYIFCVVFGIPFAVFGQGLKIEVELKQAVDKKIFLASHYLGNIYVKDTVLTDGKGVGIFESDSLLPQGLYKIYLDQNHHFDFLLGADQQLLLKNETFNSETMEVEGAEETAAFGAYTSFLRDLQTKKSELNDRLQSASTEEKEKLRKELLQLTPQLHRYWDRLSEEFPDSFLSKFVKAGSVPALDISTLPEEVQNNDSLLLNARFYYQQAHFWDYFDYTDERFLYTPFFKSKLETWFTKVLYQHHDSVKSHVFGFIEEVRPHKRIFQFAVSFFLNSSINSNIMGMDALFVDLARKYYLSGEAFWATEESLEKVRENVLFFENNLVGQTAPDLTLEGFDGEYHNLHAINARFTLVLIYEPDCSHCKVFVPGLHAEVYEPFKGKGLEVYAIYSMDNKEEWGNFLTEHNLFDWINVWDEHHVSRFKVKYDGRKTPGLYVLDKDKKIVAKKMTVEQLKDFMEINLN